MRLKSNSPPNDIELLVSKDISRQEELLKQTGSCYLKAVLIGNTEESTALKLLH